MVVRKHKTTASKQRGERTHGHGDTKNRRGSGNRGGRGRAGSHKHKFSKYYMTFGIKIRMNPMHLKGKALNVGQVSDQLNEWMRLGKVTQEDGMWVVDGKKVGIAKILGAGEATKGLYIQNIKVSEKARQKIEEAEGEIEEIFESTNGETKVADPAVGEGDK
ncbi:MAG: uL15 family ribosomal protein [archaeon]